MLADASRRQTLTGLTRLAVITYLLFGECLATSEWMRDPNAYYKTAFQMISPERLSDPLTKHIGNARVKGGVKLSASGAPIGYYIQRPKLSSFFDWYRTHQWVYVKAKTPIGRPQVIHIVDQHRPGQTRGISELVSTLKELKILRSFRDVTLQSAAVQASFAATIQSELPDWQVYEQLGSGGEGVADGVLDYSAKFMWGLNNYLKNSRHMTVNGGKIPHLLPGTKLNVMPLSTSNSGLGEGFEQSLIRYLAASLGVSYEELSRDYSETNYSSARAGMLNTFKTMQTKKEACAARFASAHFRNWFEEAVNKGDITTMNYSRVPNMYEGLNMEAYTNCKWIGTGRGQIDEFKETQAAELRIRAGLSTYEQECARLGFDWRDVFKQTARERAEQDRLNIAPVETQLAERQLEIQENANNDEQNEST